MKKEIIKTITEIEESTMEYIKEMAETFDMTIEEYLEEADGRGFRIYDAHYYDGTSERCLFTKKAYNESMKFGYGSVGFKPYEEKEDRIISKEMYDEPKMGGSIMGDLVEIIGEQKARIEGKVIDQYIYNIVGYTPKNGLPFVAMKSNIIVL